MRVPAFAFRNLHLRHGRNGLVMGLCLAVMGCAAGETQSGPFVTVGAEGAEGNAESADGASGTVFTSGLTEAGEGGDDGSDGPSATAGDGSSGAPSGSTSMSTEDTGDPDGGESTTGDGVDPSIYGDCENPSCGATCVSDEPSDPGASVCTQSCTAPSDCPPAPAGGTAPVSCSDLTDAADNECILDCSAGQTCPPGMQCFADLLCMWDVDPVMNGSYDECNSNFDCMAGQDCLTPDENETAYCAPQCGPGIGCPAHAQGQTGTCNIAVGAGAQATHCSILCTSAANCPTGAQCVPLGTISVCSWP